MLFGYPIEATEENWLHDCLSQIIQAIHENVKNGKMTIEWSSMIPEIYKSRLQRVLTVSTNSSPKRLSLGDKFKKYQTSLTRLSIADRNQVLKVFEDQNKISQLLCCECTCDTINDLPESIREPIRSVFEAAFKLLTNFEIRDKHYKLIYDACDNHICPFCGCEYFDAPGAPREALDHYIPQHKYPFAAVNLHNLVPMGNKCNSRYKLTQDILKNENGSHRRSFNPYEHRRISVSLDSSQPFEGARGDLGEPLPMWIIEFDSSAEEVDTWDQVFHIRERYERDVLNEGFKSFLREFGNYCKSWSFQPSSNTDLIEALNRYISFQEDNGFKDKAFIKAAVFRMIRLHCQNNDQRLIQLMLDQVNGLEI